MKGEKYGGWMDGSQLKAEPTEKSKSLESLVISNHWSDEDLEFTGQTKGDWAEFNLIRYSKKLEDCEESRKEKYRKKGWLRVRDSNGKMNIWKWDYTGKC